MPPLSDGSSLLIEPFGEAHLTPVVALSLRAWAPVFAAMEQEMPAFVFAAFYPEGWEARQRKDVEAICRDPGTNVWVAVKDETPAGFVGIRTHEEDGMGEIHIIAVDPACQHLGIGSMLIAFALERMREAGLAIAMVETGGDSGHAPARQAYEKAGFTLSPVKRYFREL